MLKFYDYGDDKDEYKNEKIKTCLEILQQMANKDSIYNTITHKIIDTIQNTLFFNEKKHRELKLFIFEKIVILYLWKDSSLSLSKMTYEDVLVSLIEYFKTASKEKRELIAKYESLTHEAILKEQQAQEELELFKQSVYFTIILLVENGDGSSA